MEFEIYHVSIEFEAKWPYLCKQGRISHSNSLLTQAWSPKTYGDPTWGPRILFVCFYAANQPATQCVMWPCDPQTFYPVLCV